MFPKIYFSILSFLSLVFISCNSIEEKKNNNSTRQKTDSTTSHQSVSADLLELENKVEHDSLNIELRTMLASNYYSSGELNKAAYHFLIVYELDKNNTIALSTLGNIYYDLQQDDKAIQFYQKAIALQPGNIDMKCDLATCYFRINKSKKAIEILQENIKTNYNHSKSHYNLSLILKQNGKINEANEEMKIYESLVSNSK